MSEEELERLDECQDIVTIVAVAQAATVMAHGLRAGMSPNLLLPLVEEMANSAAVAPLTKKGHELILKTVLKTLAWLPPEG